MRFDVLSIFPELLEPFSRTGVLGRAVERGTVAIALHDLRDWATNRWRQVDDEPYGGGAGMVMQAEPVVAAVRDLGARGAPARTLLLTPRGRVLDQRLVAELALAGRLVLVCGRYEGFDERAAELLAAEVALEEVSLGDFILGGGEVAAMAVVEAVARLVPGVVGDPRSVELDSFAAGLLDYPCYTRPPVVEGLDVPEVLLSGNHERIRRWRLERSVEATVRRRPDLVRRSWAGFPDEVRAIVRRFAPELAAACAAAGAAAADADRGPGRR